MPAASPSNPSEQKSDHFELIAFLGIDVQHVHGTGQSRIEGTNDPDNIEWIFDILNRGSNEGLFNRP
jgi:hypothetical protein